MTEFILWAYGAPKLLLVSAAFAAGIAAISFFAGYLFCRFRRKEKAEDDFHWRLMAVMNRIRSVKDDFVRAASDFNGIANAEPLVPEMGRRAISELSAADRSLESAGIPGVGPPEAARFLDQASFQCGRASGWIAAASFAKPMIDALADSADRRGSGQRPAMASWPVSRKGYNKPN